MTLIKNIQVGPSNKVLRNAILLVLIIVTLLPASVFTARQFVERKTLLEDEARIFNSFINSEILYFEDLERQQLFNALKDKIFQRNVSISYSDQSGVVLFESLAPIPWPSLAVEKRSDSGKLEFRTSVSDRLPIIKGVWLAALTILFMVIHILVKFVFSRWKIAEKDEQEARQNLVEIVELSSDWFWESDSSGTITQVITKEDINIITAMLQGQIIWQIPCIEPIEYQSILEASFKERKTLSFMLKMQHRGATSWHKVKANPSYSDDGLFLGYKGAGLDVTAEESKEQKINQLQEVVVQAMGSLAETRDNETGHHIIRTKHYVRELALALNHHPEFSSDIDETYIELLYLSAPLHDIGKVGIPDSILCKPGKLTFEEFEIMKTHTTLGYEAIVRAENALGIELDFLKHAKDIALFHQEKWDGSGYPMGLSGNEIPLSARLMALADVYDALISRRVYKPPFSHDEAVQIIGDGSGKHFDPRVVGVFMEIQEVFKLIADEHADPE